MSVAAMGEHAVRSIIDRARRQVLEQGVGLDQSQLVEVLSLPDESLEELLDLARPVRVKWCGEDVEVEGIISLKTGGCPEDCHFCSQSGQFTSPVRSVWLNIPELVEAAKQTAEPELPSSASLRRFEDQMNDSWNRSRRG